MCAAFGVKCGEFKDLCYFQVTPYNYHPCKVVAWAYFFNESGGINSSTLAKLQKSVVGKSFIPSNQCDAFNRRQGGSDYCELNKLVLPVRFSDAD